MDFTPEDLDRLQGLRSQFSPEDLNNLDSIRGELRGPSTASKVASDIGTGLTEAPAQALRGAEKAVNEASDAAYGLGDWLNDHVVDLGSVEFGKNSSNGWVSWHRGMPVDGNTAKIPEAVIPGEAKSVTGGLVEGVSQFTTGMLVAGRFLKGVEVATAASTAGKVGQGLAKGAIADATVFDPHAERLSNLIEQHPALQNPLTDFLAAKPEDSEAMGRFKNAAEGLGLGAASEALMLGVQALKWARAGKPEEAAKVTEELAGKAPEPDHPIKLPEDHQMEFDLQGGGPGKDSPRPMLEERKAAEEAKAAGEPSPAAKKLIDMDAEGLRKSIDEGIKEEAYGQGRVLHGLNTAKIANGDDVNAMLSGLRTVYRESYEAARGGTDGVRDWAQVRANAERLADTVGGDTRVMMQNLSSLHGNLMHLDAEVKLQTDFHSTIADKVYRLSNMVADPQGGHVGYESRTALMQDFAKHYELLSNVSAMVRGVKTNVARSLGAMRMSAEIDPKLILSGAEGVFEQGERRMQQLARQVVATGGDAKRITQTTKEGFLKKFLNSTNEYWINSVLSGPKTHIVNVASGIATSAFMPAERMLAGAIRGGTQAGRQEILEGALQYVGMAASLREATALAGRAFKKGDAILDVGHTALDTAPAISAARWNVQNPLGALIMNGLGQTARLPSRFLTSEDEFMKQLNYRAAVRAQAWREGYEQGLWRDPKALGALVAQRLDESIDAASGAGRNAEALERARSVTFTNSLATQTHGDWQSMGEFFQNMGNVHPGFRMIVPFVRAPTNIMRFVFNRTPGLNLMRKQVQNDLLGKNGPQARSDAAAQMATGSVLWAAAANYAMSGDITGGGPKDREVKKMLKETGWLPYSVKTTGEDGKVTYTAYDRTDPFGMFFGIAADYAEIAGHLHGDQADELVAAVVVSTVKNLQSKSYLSGITNAIGALAEPERKAEFFARSIVGGFVPNVLNQTFSGDDYMREARSMLDTVKAKIPGYSETVDPVRNVFGEKVLMTPAWGPDHISPIAQNMHKEGTQPGTEAWKHSVQTDLKDELARQMFIHDSPIRPPGKKDGTVDFTAYKSPNSTYTAYDRYQELAGTVEIGGKTMKQALDHLIKSDVYQHRLSDGDLDFNGSRADQLKAVIGGYRKKALMDLRKEIPELDTALRQEARRKAMMKIQQN